MKITNNVEYMSKLALIQGLYYLITGVWPIIHMASFIEVTGPKHDLWLVRTVAMLIIVLGAGLIAAGIKKEITLAIIIIAVGGAIGFILVDVIYVLLDVIDEVYLLDAIAELILLACWGFLIFKDFSPDEDPSKKN